MVKTTNLLGRCSVLAVVLGLVGGSLALGRGSSSSSSSSKTTTTAKSSSSSSKSSAPKEVCLTASLKRTKCVRYGCGTFNYKWSCGEGRYKVEIEGLKEYACQEVEIQAIHCRETICLGRVCLDECGNGCGWGCSPELACKDVINVVHCGKALLTGCLKSIKSCDVAAPAVN